MAIQDPQIFEELCLACRSGDIERVDLIVSSGVNINQVDEWDYSPLILSSLCGHKEIVQFLLQRGAVCDRDTFEGARCIYGALNDEIRNILLSYDISKAVDDTQPFAAHISSLLLKPKLTTADIVVEFANSDKVFKLNRFLLSARSAYFAARLSNRGVWSASECITLDEKASEVFEVVVDYLYLVSDIEFDSFDKDDLIKFANLFQLADLAKAVELLSEASGLAERSKMKHTISYTMIKNARDDLSKFLVEEILKKREIVYVNFEDEDDLRGLGDEYLDTSKFLSNEQRMKIHNSSCAPDIILSVVNEDSIVYYPCHKSILIRSEYYETMFKSAFFESQQLKVSERGIISRNTNPGQLQVVQMSVDSSAIAEIILGYLYYDDADIPVEYAIDVLYAADSLFIERLKTMAAVAITNSDLDEYYSIYDILRAGWGTRVDRLEHFVAEKIANNLDKYIAEEEFAEIVLESANRIEARQETDTIELIDDIRFYLNKKFAIDTGDSLQPDLIGPIVHHETEDEKEFNKQIERIEDFLSGLGLDA